MEEVKKICDNCKECPEHLNFESYKGHQGKCILKRKDVMLNDKACDSYKEH